MPSFLGWSFSHARVQHHLVECHCPILEIRVVVGLVISAYVLQRCYGCVTFKDLPYTISDVYITTSAVTYLDYYRFTYSSVLFVSESALLHVHFSFVS